jgi:hypothetical protein
MLPVVEKQAMGHALEDGQYHCQVLQENPYI